MKNSYSNNNKNNNKYHSCQDNPKRENIHGLLNQPGLGNF
jgi:hypothetical protein